MRIFLAGLLALLIGVAPMAAIAKEKAPKEPKVVELLTNVNELMSDASAAYVDGNAKEAIEIYRKAMLELDRIEDDNPVRATTSEFAPVKFRRALCETETDRIMLEEMNATARTVTVTDTTALEKKRAERKKAAETNNMPEAAIKLTTKQGKEPDVETIDEPARKERSDIKFSLKEELEFAKDMLSVDHFDATEKSLVKILKHDPENLEARLLMALLRVQQNQASDALIVLDDILQSVPEDESALLLSSGAYTATGNYAKALEALDKALKVNPKRPDAYHNMAWLLIEMNPDKLEEPEMYYRQAVKLGGPRDRDLERRLGIKSQ